MENTNFKEVNCEIKHIHDTSYQSYYHGLSSGQITTTKFNEIQVKILVPEKGFKAKEQYVFCPYCHRKIKVKATSGVVMKTINVIHIILGIPLVLFLSVCGYNAQESKILGIGVGILAGIFLDFVLLMLFSGILNDIEPKPFYVEPKHNITKIISKKLKSL
jgi:hypothetical protein